MSATRSTRVSVAWAQGEGYSIVPSGHCLRTTNSTPLFRRFKRQEAVQTTADCTYRKIRCPPAPLAARTFGYRPGWPARLTQRRPVSAGDTMIAA